MDGDQRCAETRDYSAACLSCDCQDDTERRGNPNSARAHDLTGIPEVPVCFSLRISLHVAQLVPLSV